MPVVKVYTKPLCPLCFRALALLKEKGAQVEEIQAAFNRAIRDEMIAKSNGAKTYPQIFIGAKHIGGCEELMALDREGKLEALLNAG